MIINVVKIKDECLSNIYLKDVVYMKLKKIIVIIIAIALFYSTMPQICEVNAMENASTDIKIKNVSIGGFWATYHMAAVTEGGDLYCWGFNEYGQVGNGTTIDQTKPEKVLSNVKDVELGLLSSAAITEEGDLYCWGEDYNDEGVGGAIILKPEKVLSNVKDVELGQLYIAAITEEGDLYCWGANSYGQIGNGTTITQITPVKVLSNVKSVSLGATHSAAITEEGDLYCWGANENGQVGDGTNIDRLTPEKIMSNVKSVSLHAANSAAITEEGDLYCWGLNKDGQIGDGKEISSNPFIQKNQNVPLKVLSNVKEVSIGGMGTGVDIHSAAVTEEGDLYCWGANENGQAGNEKNMDQSTPEKIMSNVKSVSLGKYNYNGMAITEEDDLYCWGYNENGQVGNGTKTRQNTPVKILSNIKSAFSYGYNSTALTKDGELYCWGYNRQGQVGDGTYTERNVPVKIFGKEAIDIQFGKDKFSFGKAIEGTAGETVETLLLLDSALYEIEDLQIDVEDKNIADIKTVNIGAGGYITSGNEKIATIYLDLKSEGTTNIVITVLDGTKKIFPINVRKSNYEIKLYSEVSAMIVGEGKAIGAAVQLENNGTVIEDFASFSIISSDTDIVKVDNIRNKSDGTYFDINGIKEGTAKLTITELNTGQVYSSTVHVNAGILTYNAEALPKYYDHKYEYNGYIGGMFIDSFESYKKNNDKMSVSFNVYNTMNIVGTVDVYDSEGILYDTVEIKRFNKGYVTSLKDTAISGGWLIADLFSRNIFTYKQNSYSEETRIRDIEVPIGGHIEITNDPIYSNTCALYNSTEFVVDSILLFGGVLDLTANTKKEVSQKAADNVVKRFVKSYVDAIKGNTSQEKVANLGRMFVEKLRDKAAKKILKSGIEGNIASFVDEGKVILKECNIDIDKIIIQCAGDIGVSIGESTLKKAMGPFGDVLNGMFTFSEYVDYSTFFVNICKKHDLSSLNIYFDNKDGALCDNGVSIKSINDGRWLSENNFVMHSIVLSNENDLSSVTKNALDEISNDYIVRNVYLERDGKISQPGQNVQVTIPIPDDYEPSKCKVYWIQDDGTLTEMATTISDGVISFNTNHFSYYAIVQMKEDPTYEPSVTQPPELMPTLKPSDEPTVAPTETPIIVPTIMPSETPTSKPTVIPTITPSAEPTEEPQKTPTETPTIMPTSSPAAEPTEEPNQSNKPYVPTQVPTPPQENAGNNPTGGNINNVLDISKTDIGTQTETQPTDANKKQTTDSIVAKTLKLKGVKCIASSKKIIGKVSVSKAKVKIKVGSKAYKKAAIKGKKFKIVLGYKLRKNTKVTIKVTKKGYKGIKKILKVK